MIQIKEKINKSAMMHELREYAEKTYANSYESEYAIEKFMEGAESLLKLLRIDAAVNCPDCSGKNVEKSVTLSWKHYCIDCDTHF
jgi:hypothetical protein